MRRSRPAALAFAAALALAVFTAVAPSLASAARPLAAPAAASAEGRSVSSSYVERHAVDPDTLSPPPLHDSSLYSIVNVTFPSAAVPSGQIELAGSFVLPPPSFGTGPFPLAVLVHGSGPNDRWETLRGGYHPFFDVATSLASNGVVVVTYDKRECAFIPGICSYTKCSPTVPPGSGCVDFKHYSLTDLQSDAISAVDFTIANLPALTGLSVLSTNVTVIGHSQGCTVAPMIGAAIPSVVSTVILLMGSGVSIDVTLMQQGAVQSAINEANLQYWIDQPDSNPNKASEVTAFETQLFLTGCEANNAIVQFDLLRLGVVAPTDNAVICPFAFPWPGNANLPAGNYCPAECEGTSVPTTVCKPGINPPLNATCTVQCGIGYAAYACLSPLFANSWLEASEDDAAMAALTGIKGRILSINSFADLLVVKPAFLPLHLALAGINGTGTNVQTMVQTYANLTHDMIVQYSTQTSVYPPLLAYVTAYVLAGQE